MDVTTYTCSSCALASIIGVGYCQNPEDALRDFCLLVWPNSVSPFASGGKSQLAPFYIFVAGPEVSKEHPNGSHHSKAWVRYGTEFAQYLVTHKLGTVVTTGARFNKAHHPDTTCQVWIWAPNHYAVVEWWNEHGTSGRE